MSSINNLPSFTRALTAFCLVLFVFLFLPSSLADLSNILKYLLLVGIIVVLMMYNKVLGSLSTSEPVPHKANMSPSSQDHYAVNKAAMTDLYDNLQSLVLSTAKAVNPKFDSGIYMIDPESQVFSLQRANSDDFSNSIPVTNQLVNSILQNNNTVYQKDSVDAWNELFASKPWRGSECVLGSPISLNDATAGFVLTRVEHFSDITDKDKAVLGTLGDFISFGLGNLQSLEKHILGDENKARILELLSNLNFKSDETQILEHFKFLIRTFFQYARLTISLKNEIGINSAIKLVDGVQDDFEVGSEFPTNSSLHGLPIVSGEIVLTNNWKETHSNLSRFSSDETESEFCSVLGMPIIIDGESCGSMILERLTKIPFSQSDQQTFKLMGQVLGSSLNWLNEYEKIYQNATHDGLSGLLNHQTFKERFTEEIERAKRFQHHMAFLIFDLDKFKRINDTFGHPYGDYVIQTTANILSDNVRTVDAVARYGGEEFAIILINTTAEMAMVVGQRIVDNIADFPFSMDGDDVRMTISCGMSLYPSHSENMKDLIDLADQTMYKTKQNGGNGITLYAKDNETDEKKN